MTSAEKADPKQDHATSEFVLNEAEEGVGRLNEPPKPPSVTDKWFADLVNRWKDHYERGLRIRHETGTELNRRIGPPAGRQERFGEVVTALAAQLRVHVSEISRMRNFAVVFSEFKFFEMEHPEVTSWSQVKAHLPEWTAKARGETFAAKPRQSVKPLTFIVRGIKAATIRLDDDALVFDEIEKKELLLEIEKLGRPLQRRFGVELTTAEIPQEDLKPQPA